MWHWSLLALMFWKRHMDKWAKAYVFLNNVLITRKLTCSVKFRVMKVDSLARVRKFGMQSPSVA